MMLRQVGISMTIYQMLSYISAAKAMGIYYLSAMTIKDLCYLRLSYMIKRGQLTFSDKVANAVYTHQTSNTESHTE